MKKSIKRNYIIEIIILIFNIILYLILKTKPNLVLYLNVILYFILAIITYLINGYPKNKNYINKISTRYIIIALLLYLILTYLLGLFTGFLTPIFKHDIISIIKNILPIIIIIYSKELIRYIICKNTDKSNKIIIIITILYILSDIILKNYNYKLNNISSINTFIFLICIPSITRQFLSTYIVSNIGINQSIIYNLAFDLSIYIFPIYPDLGNYLNSVLGLIFPYLIYKQLSKLVNYNHKKRLSFNKTYYIILIIFIISILIFIVILTSGIFSYKMIAIGSDSMNPIYYKGDAIIYKKVNIDNIKEKDILVYNYNGFIITHRVKKIIIKGNKRYFQTKGDNNNKVDDILVEDKQVYGIVKYIVKYAGYPTIYLQEIFY